MHQNEAFWSLEKVVSENRNWNFRQVTHFPWSCHIYGQKQGFTVMSDIYFTDQYNTFHLIWTLVLKGVKLANHSILAPKSYSRYRFVYIFYKEWQMHSLPCIFLGFSSTYCNMDHMINQTKINQHKSNCLWVTKKTQSMPVLWSNMH